MGNHYNPVKIKGIKYNDRYIRSQIETYDSGLVFIQCHKDAFSSVLTAWKSFTGDLILHIFSTNLG